MACAYYVIDNMYYKIFSLTMGPTFLSVVSENNSMNNVFEVLLSEFERQCMFG